MKKRLTQLRLAAGIISMAAEQAAIYAVWRWLLPELGINLDFWVVVVIMALWLAMGIFLFIAGTNILGRKELPGLTSMIGLDGKANSRLDPQGMVKIKGELWDARAESGTIEPGANITVSGEDGLKLIVRKRE